jgi:spermidine synthase
VPLYSAGIWSWTYATERTDPMAIDDARASRIESVSKTYNRDLHRAAFVKPQYVTKRLAIGR